MRTRYDHLDRRRSGQVDGEVSTPAAGEHFYNRSRSAMAVVDVVDGGNVTFRWNYTLWVSADWKEPESSTVEEFCRRFPEKVNM